MNRKIRFTIIFTSLAVIISSCLTVEKKIYTFEFTGKNSGILTIKYVNLMSMVDYGGEEGADNTGTDFEDLIDNQRSTFISALASLGLASNSSTIEAAFSKFSFQNMKETEDAFGFSERPPHTRSFFRAGKSNTYLNYLSKQQIDRIVSRHGETMEKLNYLP